MDKKNEGKSSIISILHCRFGYKITVMKIRNLVFGCVLLLFGWLIFSRIMINKQIEENSKPTVGKKAPVSVDGMIVKPSVFNDNLSLSGTVEANEQIEIRSEVSGIVDAIYFQEGNNVQKGQILFKVNDVELKAQLLQIETKENLAIENERRAKFLLDKAAISQEEYDITKSELKSIQAQIQLVKAQIDKTFIKAPFSGKIGLRNISPGAYITPANLVGKLLNTDKLKITFSIPEKYAPQVKKGTDIHFTVAGSAELFIAKIYATEPGIDLNTRTLQVRAIMSNTGQKVLPGSYADIIFPLNSIKDAISIPSQAIVPVQGGKKVYIVNNGSAKEQLIESSTRTDSSILVVSGLKMGDTLIISGVMSLKAKVPVKINLVQ